MDTQHEKIECSRCGQERHLTPESPINLLKHSICNDCLGEEEAEDLYHADQEELQNHVETLAKLAVKLLKTALQRNQNEVADSEMPLNTAETILNEGKQFKIDMNTLLEDPMFSRFLTSSN